MSEKKGILPALLLGCAIQSFIVAGFLEIGGITPTPGQQFVVGILNLFAMFIVIVLRQ